MFAATLTSEAGEVLGNGVSTPPQELPPFLGNLVGEAGNLGLAGKNPGGCAEINAIVNSGLSQAELEGTTMTVIRGGSGPHAGTISIPCDTCKHVLNRLKINVTPGPGW